MFFLFLNGKKQGVSLFVIFAQMIRVTRFIHKHHFSILILFTMIWQERTALLLGQDRVEKLNRSHVLIVGLGGVGATAAEMLCRAGIGHLTIVDADVVHPTNINRQLPALHSTIGKSKALVSKDRLQDINPEAEIIALTEFLKNERTETLLTKTRFDFVVDAIDSISPKVYLLYHCCRKQIPVVSAMGAGGKVNLADIRQADISDTYQCALAKVVRKRLKELGIDKGIPVVFSPEPVRKNVIIEVDEPNKRSSAGTVSYAPIVFGCYLSEYVIKGIICLP